MKLYMAVTPDQYELPLCVQDSPGELAEALGITINAVRTSCAPSKASKSGTKRDETAASGDALLEDAKRRGAVVKQLDS